MCRISVVAFVLFFLFLGTAYAVNQEFQLKSRVPIVGGPRKTDPVFASRDSGKALDEFKDPGPEVIDLLDRLKKPDLDEKDGLTIELNPAEVEAFLQIVNGYKILFEAIDKLEGSNKNLTHLINESQRENDNLLAQNKELVELSGNQLDSLKQAKEAMGVSYSVFIVVSMICAGFGSFATWAFMNSTPSRFT